MPSKKRQLGAYPETTLGVSSSWRWVTGEPRPVTRSAGVAVAQGRQRPRDKLRGKIIAFSRLSLHFHLKIALVLDVLPVHDASSEVHPEVAATQTTGPRAWFSTEVRWYVAMPCVCPCTGLPPRLTTRLLLPKPRDLVRETPPYRRNAVCLPVHGASSEVHPEVAATQTTGGLSCWLAAHVLLHPIWKFWTADKHWSFV